MPAVTEKQEQLRELGDRQLARSETLQPAFMMEYLIGKRS